MKRSRYALVVIMILLSAIMLYAGCNHYIDDTIIWNNENAYAYAQSLGYEGNLEEFILSISGRDGIGIATISINDVDQLIITLTTGEALNLGNVKGPTGEKGDKGQNGQDGINGQNGQDGINGQDGQDGQDGKDGLTPFIGENGNWWIGDSDTGVAADITHYFIVKLDYGNNTVPSETTVKQGDTIDLPILTKDNYVFMGWYTGMTVNDRKFTSYDGVFSDMTLYARYEKYNEYYYTEGLSFNYLEHSDSYSVYMDKESIWYSIRSTYQELIIPKYYNDEIHGYREVTHIAMDAFTHCINVNKIILPDTITYIGQWAFRFCKKLTEITIPYQATISSDTFDSCISLEKINIQEGSIKYKNIDGVIFNYAETTLIRYAPALEIESYVVPSSVINIYHGAFDSAQYLKNVELPQGIEVIRNRTFSNCIALETVDIPDSVITIESSAFSGCKKLNNISLPDGLMSIGSSAFSSCESLTSIILPVNITKLERSTFSACVKLESINLENVSIISSGVFSGCVNLNNITLSSDLTTIEEYTFYRCSRLEYITIPDSVTSIGNNAFNGCLSLTNITIPSNVISLGDDIFSYCSNLETIEVAEDNINYKSIDGVLFNKAGTILLIYPVGSDRTEYIVPEGVTTIGGYAFAHNNLYSIVLPSTITNLSYFAVLDSANSINITILSATPPSLGTNVFFFTIIYKIYVYEQYVDTYKSIWINYANKIYAIEE